MKNSRKIQTAVQIVGSFGEIFLFLAGFFLGSKAFAAACGFIIARVVLKLLMSELMYNRQIAVINEGFERANHDTG